MLQQIQAKPYTTWQLIKSFWQSEHRIFAWVSLIVVLGMTILLVGLETVFSYWYKAFYDSLQTYSKGEVYDLIAIFFFLAAVIIVTGVYRYYLQSFLALRWRRWLTEQFLQRWLDKQSYYYLENFDKTTDNPDQRIQEDLGAVVTSSLSLLVGLINSLTTIPAFIYILWTLSGILTVHLGSLGVLKIPGYLAWVGVLYAVIGTFLTFKIGRPLIMLNFEQQRKEADFRFAAVDLRSHSENVALYRGEHHQQTILSGLLDRLLNNWYLIILRQKLLLWFTLGYNQLAVILPLAVALPNYFNRVFELGGLIQALKAFTTVQESLSFLVNAYTQIAEWRAVNRRLVTFLNHMHDVDESAHTANHFIFKTHSSNDIVVKNVTLFTPEHELLLKDISQAFRHGGNYLITGVSGIGKSTFVRALADIWPYGSGEITLPANKKMMYLSQRPYMPLGTLEQALLFPDNINLISETVWKELLTECDLADLIPRLHEVAVWSTQLSPGEQQRIAFIRVFIHKPDWVILDESTSSLDLPHEKSMYSLMKKYVPHCSIITVGHQPSLHAYHEYVIDFERYSNSVLVS